MDEKTILIIGAGAAGLMAARELTKEGQKVLILEARERIGGRIMPLNQEDFGYPAQGGAEWVHGEAPITKALIKEAGLTLIAEDGEIWSTRNGEMSLNKSFIQSNKNLKNKLEALKEDVSISEFLEKNFTEESDKDFKNSILKVVEGYDAADPRLISTFTLRDEWLSNTSMMELDNDHRIKEGYGALIKFLEKECLKNGVKINLNSYVDKIEAEGTFVSVYTSKGETFNVEKVVIAVPLPILKDIKLSKELKHKQEIVNNIGYGNAIKVLMKFKTRWWENTTEKDLSKMAFMLCNEEFLTWWTQYPQINTVLTGWMAGPVALKYKNYADEEIFNLAVDTLTNILKIKKEAILDDLVIYKVVNWPGDPFTKGAYSYTTVDTKGSYKELAEPYKDQVFFAGEALYSGEGTATVEGALGSGLETARKILKIF